MHFMVSWGTPILIQAITIWLIIAVIALPLAALIYRKRYGKIPGRRMIIMLIVLLYAVGIISFTFLPLPDPQTFQCGTDLNYPRFFPGWSVEFALRNTESLGVLRFATWWFVQIYLNVLLFVPWGFIARAVYKMNFRATLLSGFAATLLIELTQLTGIWGIYPCRYRTFDVDDMITNTLGAMIGWLLVEAYMRFRPKSSPQNKRESRPR